MNRLPVFLLRSVNLIAALLLWLGLPSAARGVDFSIGSGTVGFGETIDVPVTVSGFIDVTSVDLSIAWDPAVLLLVNVTGNALTGPAFSESSDRIGMSWFDEQNAEPLTLADGTTIITLTFAGIGGPGSSTTVRFDNSPTNFEVAVNYEESSFTSSSGQVTIQSKETPVITWNNPVDMAYGTPLGPDQLNAMANVAGTFSYSPASGAVLNAGAGQKLQVTFTPTDSERYATATKQVTLNVLRAPLTITGPTVSRSYGAPNPTFTATYSGFVNGDTSASLDTPPSLSTTATLLSPPGEYPITVSGAADANYDITFVSGALSIGQALLTIRADDKTRAYGEPNPEFTGSIEGLLNSDQLSLVFSTVAVLSSGVGTYGIVPSLVGAVDNYAVTVVEGTLTVTPAPLTVRAENKTKKYGETLPELTASFDGFVNGDTVAALSVLPTLATEATALSPVGTFPITASGAEAANYSIAYADGSLTITPAALTVTPAGASRIYGADNPAFTGLIDGALAGDGITATYSTSATAASGVGEYEIIAALNDPNSRLGNYEVSLNTGVLTVTPAPLTITAENKTKIFGAPLPEFTATISGFVNGETAAVLTSPLTLTTTATADSPVGTYPITPSGAASPNYAIQFAPGVLSVTRILPELSWLPPAPIVYGTPLGSAELNAQSGIAGLFQYDPPVGTVLPAGEGQVLSVTFNPADTQNYDPVTAQIEIDVLKAELTVNAENASRLYGDANPQFSAQFSGFVNGDTASVLSGPVTFQTAAGPDSPVGEYAIVPGGADSANYKLVFQNGSLLIEPAPLSIRAENASRPYGGANPSFAGAIDGLRNGETFELSFATTATAASPVGEYPITPVPFDAADRLRNYVVSANPGTLVVTPALLTIRAEDKSKAYGEPLPEFTAAFNGFVNGETADVLSAAPVLSTDATASSDAGTYPIRVTGAAAPNYSIEFLEGTLTVTPVNPVLTWNPPAAIVYGTALGANQLNAVSGIEGQFRYSPEAGAVLPAGDHTLEVAFDPSDAVNYTPATASIQIRVNPAPLTVRANNQSRVFGEANPELTVSYSGFVNGDTASVVTAQPVVSTTATLNSPPGEYPITVTGGAAANYLLSHVNGVLTVLPANQPPTISPVATVTIDEDTSSSVIPFVVADLETPIASLQIGVRSSNPALVPNNNLVLGGSGANRSLTIIPAADLNGTTTITISVNDGTLVAERSFDVIVRPVNDRPTISLIADLTLTEDVASSLVSLAINDIETVPSNLSISVNSSNPSLIPQGNIVIGGSGAERTVTIIPAENQSGSGQVTLTVSDGDLSASTGFQVTVTPVNDPPTISGIADQRIDEDGVAGPLAFVVGDVDTASSSLTLSATSSNSGLVPVANIELLGAGADRTIRVVPAPNQSGQATIRVVVGDGELSAESAFNVTVIEVNDAPSISTIADQATNEDTSTRPLPFVIGDVETPADQLTLSAESSNPELIPPAGILFGGSGGNRSIILTPATGQNGSASITVNVSDGALSRSTTFSLTVNPGDRAPVISEIADVSIDEDGTAGPIAFQVGDPDTPLEELTLAVESSNTALLPRESIVLSGSGADRALLLKPAPNQNGESVVTVTVRDQALFASASFTVQVRPVNDFPVIAAIGNRVTPEDQPVSIAVRLSDPDHSAGDLVLTARSSNSALVPAAAISITGAGLERSLTVTPAADQNGSAVIELTVSDGLAVERQSFLLTVQPVNDPPVIGPVEDTVLDEDGSSGPIVVNVQDVDDLAETLIVSVEGSDPALLPPSGLVLEGRGNGRTLRITPAPDRSGSAQVTIAARDAELSATRTFRVTVREVNDPPAISDVADVAIDENQLAGPLAVMVTDKDTTADRLIVRASSSNETLVPASNVAVEGNSNNRTVTVTPAAGQSGSAVIRLEVSDGELTASDTFTLTVRALPKGPVISELSNLSVDEDTGVGPLSLRISDSDTQPAEVGVKVRSSNRALVPEANIALTGAGEDKQLVILPAANQNGTTQITVVASDGVFVTERSFELTVRPVNDLPVISAIGAQAITESTPTRPILFEVSDAETAPANLQVTVQAEDSTLLPASNITLSGAGTSRSLVLLPAPARVGGTRVEIAVVDADGGRATAAFDLVVSAGPPTIIEQPANLEITAGSEARFSVMATGTEPLSYQWFANGIAIQGETGPSLTIPAIQAAGQGLFSVTVSNAHGAVTSREARLKVNSPPAISEHPRDQVAIAGGSARFSVKAAGSGTLSFQWFRGNDAIAGATAPELLLENLRPEDAGEIRVTVRNAIGETRSETARLMVNVPPEIQTQPAGGSVNEGASFTMSVAASGLPAPEYQWYKDDQLLDGRTSPSLVIQAASAADHGSYKVVVRNAAGEVISDAALLRVIVPPTITRQPAPVTVTASPGGTTAGRVVLNVVATGSDLAYQWRFVPANPPGPIQTIAGAAGPELVLDNVGAAQDGNYSVVVSNSAGSRTSASARLRINVPVAITTQPQSVVVNQGGLATLSVAASGTPAPTFQWQFEGVNLAGQTGPTLTLNNVQPARAGAYRVIVRNEFAGAVISEVASSEALVTVREPVVIRSQPVSISRVLGSSARFEVGATGTGPLAYQWRRNGADIPGATAAALVIPSVQATDAGAYTVVVSNAVGPVTSQSASLTVQTPPGISQQPQSQTVPLGASVTFSVTATGDAPIRYQWLRNGANIPGATASSYTINNVTAADAGTYSVVVQNNAGAITSAPAVLQVSLPSLTMTDNLSQATAVDVTAGIFDGGTNENATREPGELDHAGLPPARSVWFGWQAPASGVTVMETVGSTFDTILAVYGGPRTALTDVGSDDDGGGFGTSRVTFYAEEGTVYWIAVDGFDGARGQVVVSVTLTPELRRPPQILAQPLSQSVLEGANVSFSVQASGDNLSYQWLVNDTPIPGATSSSLTLSNVQLENAGKYRVVVSGPGPNPLSVESAVAVLEISVEEEVQSQDKFGNLPSLFSDLGQLNRFRRPGKRAGTSVARGFSGSQVFSTFGASKEQGEPNHAGAIGGASQWFSYQAPATGVLRVSTDGSDFDTVLGVYSGPGTSFDTLVEVGSDDNSGADGQDSVAFVPVAQGTVYFIAVDGVGGVTGKVVLTYELAQPPAIVQQPVNLSVVAGATASFSVTTTNLLSQFTTNAPPQAFQWLKNGVPVPGATASTLSLTNALVADAGVYSVLVANYAGMTPSAEATLVVSVPLSITRQPLSQTAKTGARVLLSAQASGSAPISYQWSRNGVPIPNATQASYEISAAVLADAAAYTCAISNAVSSAVTATAVLTVIEPPRITAAPESRTIAAGESVVFSVAATGTAPLTYQWRFNGVNIPGATQPMLNLQSVALSGAGEYSVVVGNAAESVVSPPAVLTVNAPVRITSPPSDQTVNEGSAALFSVVAVGSGTLTYQWHVNGVPIAGATRSSFALQSTRQSDAGQYGVTVSDASGAVSSPAARLSVISPPVITAQPEHQTAQPGTAVTFQVTAAGTGPLEYQWFFEGEPIIGATGSTVELQASRTGNVTAQVRNAAGSVLSDAALLNVPEVVSQVALSNGTFQFQLSVPPGREATIEVSNDLTNWRPLTPTPLGSGNHAVEDPAAGGFVLQFYRIVVR